MYLDKLTLNNFRSFAQSEIPLCKDLTLLVGENNGGKSHGIDAVPPALPAHPRCPETDPPAE